MLLTLPADRVALVDGVGPAVEIDLDDADLVHLRSYLDSLDTPPDPPAAVLREAVAA